VVTVNGEIYNHKELKAHILEKCPGKKFNTQSDCEVGVVPLHGDMVHATGGMHRSTGFGKHFRDPCNWSWLPHRVTCFSSPALAATVRCIHFKQWQPRTVDDTLYRAAHPAPGAVRSTVLCIACRHNPCSAALLFPWRQNHRACGLRDHPVISCTSLRNINIMLLAMACIGVRQMAPRDSCAHPAACTI
jgi:hypothetical protein